jgi:putative DNA primase/helicase
MNGTESPPACSDFIPRDEDDVDTQEWIDAEIARLDARQVERDRQDSQTGFCKDLPLSDVGNAERLVKRYGRDLLYCHPWRKWFIWDGTRWAPDDTGKIMRLAKDTAMRIGDEAHAAGGSSDLYKWAGTSQSHPRINAMVALTQSEVPVLPADLDADPNLINFPNGTLELDTFTFREHKREDRCTKAMGCEYLPDATCPLWVQFLDTIFDKNDNLIKFVQRGLGYSLTAAIGERAIFLCHGSGANGKSTLLNTVASAMGEYARQTESNTFCQQKHDGVRNDIAALKGARYVIAIESKKGKRLDEALVKQLSGGDTVAARFLFQEYFEFKPEFKIWWAFNHKPRIDDTTQSVWDRVKLIPFNIVIPLEERDKDLPAKLVKELPGIVAWMVNGLREYRNIGLAEPAEVTVATQEYQAEQDRLGDFLSEECVEDPTAWTSSSELYNAYQNWCNDNHEIPISPRTFGFDMGDRYHRERDKATRKKGYCGIRICKNPTLSNSPEFGKGTIENHKTRNLESPYKKRIDKECENASHGSSRFQTPKLKRLENLIAEYDLPPDTDTSRHIGFTKTGQYCICKGCGEPAAWVALDKVRPLPLCDRHYEELKAAGGDSL